MFTLDEITQSINGRSHGSVRVAFNEAVIDSRAAVKNTLFVAIPGENTDGHKFVASAFAKGAAAALIQEDIEGDYPCLDLRKDHSEWGGVDVKTPFCIRVENTIEALQKIASFHRGNLPKMEVIGLTGSVGKTTTKELVSQVLSERFNTLKTAGNMNNEIGLPLTLLRADGKTEKAVLEMGFYVPGEIRFLCNIANPRIGIITNVGMVHASRAGSMEVIAQGKRELVEELPEDGVAILNYDDPYVRSMADFSKARVFTYGMDPKADLWADDVESFGLEGIRFTLHYQKETHLMKAPLIGRHSVLTALRAVSLGLIAGMTWEEILKGIRHGETQLRLTVEHTAEGATIIDDTYNASPESTLAALNLLAEIPGRRVAVLGDMRELGQYERKGHEMVGIRAAAVCDELIAVGTASKMLAEAALSAGMESLKVHWFAEVPEVIEYMMMHKPQKTDIILVKGSRSLQMERITKALEARDD